jgi:hypothetical protein
MKLNSIANRKVRVWIATVAVFSILAGGIALVSMSNKAAHRIEQADQSKNQAVNTQEAPNTDSAPNHEGVQQQPDTNEITEQLYDSSLPATAVYSELIQLADAGNGRAALRVVDIDMRCWLSSSSAKTTDYAMKSLSDTLTSDPDGRYFFNMSLTFPGSGVSTFDDYTSYTSLNQDFCAGFEASRDTQNWLKYLMFAAEDGFSDAQIASWGMPPSQALNASAEDSNRPAIPIHGDKRTAEWNELKLKYLTEAGKSGDPRAWVLLGDAYSGQSPWLTPDLGKAYAYYYLAEGQLDFPFVGESLRDLRARMSKHEVEAAEEFIQNYKHQ